MVGKRRLVVLVSGIAMVLFGAGIVGVLVAATQSVGGREWIRRALSRELALGMHGTLHLGRLSGSFLTDLAIDSVAVIDPDDSVFFAFGPTRLTYDPRDILDGRIIVRSVDIDHPFVAIRKENDDRWNFRKVFPVENERPPEPSPSRHAFGALVVFRNVRVHDGQFQLTLPWQPDDSLTGARRDSAIATNLGDRENEIRRVVTRGRPGFQRTWRWTSGNATLTRVRFRQPDTTGRQFDIARMDVDEHVPPFAFHNITGGFLWRGDTIWADLKHFELPASVGKATGTIRWGSDGPIRYDVRVHGDSVALRDIAWVYETLPRIGGGSMDLHIHNERDPRILDYAITNMDARSNGSRLRGTMTYGVGGPVLLVKDVRLDFAPVDFSLLETLNGRPFPYPWRGTITGSVQASGGPVNHFQVQSARLAFADRNVPGATAAGTGEGELDILSPGLVKFHGFHVNVDHFDLRTAQFVNANVPRLNGPVSGTATLDSIWTDVRFSDADITHRDGDDETVSHLRGGGRVTLGDDFVNLDLSLAALPLSATALGRSYPGMPFRGDFSGPLRVTGNVSDLSVIGDLVGDAGRVQLDGRFDLYSPGYRAVARGSVSGVDLRRALGRRSAPTSSFNGRFAVDLSGDSLADLFGTAQLFADRSLVDGVRVYSAQASLRFNSGTAYVDSLRLESSAGLLTAAGAIGLRTNRGDQLQFRAIVDSLGGLRRFLALRPTGDSAAAASVTDSLQGTLRASGALSGTVTRFGLRASLEGAGLRVDRTTARALAADVHLDALPDSATGEVSLRLDTLSSPSAALSRVEGRAELRGGLHGRLTATAESPLGARARASAEVRRAADTVDVRLDSLTVRTTGNDWSLERPARIALSGNGGSVDTLAIDGARGGRIAVSGRVPEDSSIALTLRADTVPLADLGEIGQAASALGGTLTLHADARGTRQRPDVFFTGALRGAQLGGLRLDLVEADGRYTNRRLTTSLQYSRLGIPALHAEATLPIDLAFRPAGPRLLDEPLSGRIRTDSIGLVLFEAMSTAVSGARGALALDLDVGGTWKHPRLTGALRVSDGALSLAPLGDVRLGGIEADVGFLGDSIAIRRITVHSGTARNATASLSGYIGIRDIEDPTFDLRLDAQGMNVVKRDRFADLDLTGTVRLSGAYRGSTLTGNLTVDRGVIYIPELYQKRVISLDDPEFYRVVDTSAFLERRLLPEAPSAFLDNLSVAGVPILMGRDVWLRSEEANVNLGGFVTITRSRVQRGPRAGQVQLALEGPLQTVRGTYRLDLGPVQRTFEVENGEVRFYGNPDLNATLNINALHTVRQLSQQGARPDVRVRVHIGGTLQSPTAELSSPDSVRVTNADLISYLVTGGPSYEITGRSGDYTSTAARVLLSSTASMLGGKASGGLCDDAQLSTAGLDAYQGRIRDVSSNILQGTRFNCAKQVSGNVFVRLDAGLCQVGQLLGTGTSSSDPLTVADMIGVKLDYRLSNNMTLSGGMDPPTSAVLCTRDANARGFAPTPRQFGFDLFRVWRF